MSKLSAIFCCLLLINSWPETSAAKRFEKAYDVFQKALELHAGFQMGQAIVGVFTDVKPPMSEGERTMISQLSQLSEDVEVAKNAILHKISDQLESKMSANINKLLNAAEKIEDDHDDYLTIVSTMNNQSTKSLLDFAEAATLRTVSTLHGSMTSYVLEMHRVLVSSNDEKESTLSLIIKESSKPGIICSRNESPQQLIEHLYELVLNSHIKVILMRQFSYIVLQKHDHEDRQQRIDEDRNRFYKKMNRTEKAVRLAMEAASRSLYRCDPKVFVKGDNFEDLGPVLQTHIVSTADLKESFGGSCDVDQDKDMLYSDFSQQLEVYKRCEYGRLRKCEAFGNEFELCYSSRESPRLYDWVKLPGNVVYGYENTDKCSNMTKKEKLGPIDKLHRNYCLCTCDSGLRTEDRFFSLIEVESDIIRNKVVTGVRLIKQGYTFFIQIQEGEIGKNGDIIGNVTWQDIVNYDKDGWDMISHFASTTTYERIRPKDRHNNLIRPYRFSTVFNRNPFVHPVTYDWRDVQLDELKTRENHVLTGLKFDVYNDELVLEIKSTPYDKNEGTLDDRSSVWLGNKFEANREKVSLNNPEVPIKSNPDADLKVASNHHYVRFTPTDKLKDLGQNTVPFLDMQAVTTNPPMPLTGAGLIHKRKGSSGGFLALQLEHYNLVN